MASGSITSWQIDGKTMKTVADFIFLGSKITVDGVHRKAMTNLDSILKSRAITLPTKVCIVKAMCFPWCWERLRAGGEGDDRRWEGWMASPTQWTWVWANCGRWWRTRKPSVLLSMGLQRAGHNWVTEQQRTVTTCMDVRVGDVKKAECQRIDDFKLWCWRRLSRVP